MSATALNGELNSESNGESFNCNSHVSSKSLSGRFSKMPGSAEQFGSSQKRKYEDDSESVEGNGKKNNFSVSPWEFRRLKADLMESQAQRIKLEDRIDQLHKKNKEAVIFFDKEKNEMKIQLESNRNTIKDLEYRINKIRRRESECREEFKEKVKLLDIAKQKLNEKIIQLEAEKFELTSKVEEYETNSEDTQKHLHDEIRLLNETNEKLKLSIEEKEELCSSLQTRLDNMAEDYKAQEDVQSQLHLALLRIKELEKEREDFEEAKSVTVALSEKVLRIPELEKELNEKKAQVTNLRQFLHNNIMLEEMVHDLRTKLIIIEEREKEIPSLKARVAYLEQELEKWISIASDFSSGTRDSLRDYIESLQRKELTTGLEINNLNAVVWSSEKTLSSLKHELDSMKMHNEKLETALQKLKVEVQVLRKKSVLISRERDSYRQQLDLYEKDLTMTGLSSETISNEILSQMKIRIQNLELSLTDYRGHVEALETQLKEYQDEDCCPESIEAFCKLKKEIKVLEDENKRLSKMKDEFEQKIESRVLQGDYVTSGIKILHFRDNPAAEAEKKQMEDINVLKEECEKLRVRVKLLESGEVFNITQKVSEDVKSCSSQRISELEKELQSANLKMQRLKEVFKKTSQEFRDVSYMLLGYRIDLASNNKLYKLYNMYSASPSDHLMFQHSRKGEMEMLGTPFAESLSKLVEEYLHRGNSIPAFLSAVTLELYKSSIQSDDEGEGKCVQGNTDYMEAIQLD